MGLGSHHLGTQNRLLRSSQHYPLGQVGERDTRLPLSGTREEKSLLALLSLHTGRTRFNATTTPGLAPPQLLCVCVVRGATLGCFSPRIPRCLRLI